MYTLRKDGGCDLLKRAWDLESKDTSIWLPPETEFYIKIGV